MNKVTPLQKMSKRARREIAKARRADWGSVVPVTRVERSAKHYDRKRDARQCRDDE